MATADEIDKAKEAIGDGSWLEKLEALPAKLGEFSTNLTKIVDQLGLVSTGLTKMTAGTTSIAQGLAGAGKEAINTGSNIEHLVTDVFGAAEGFDKLGVSAMTSTSSIQEAYKALKEHTGSIAAFIHGLGDKLPGGEAVLNFITTLGDRAVGAAERTQLIEKGFLAMTAAGGDMGNMFDTNRGLISSFDGQVVQLNERINDIVSATGMAPAEVTKAMADMAGIPKALGSDVKVAGESVDTLTVASRIAAGSMQDTSRVIDDMKFAYRNLSGETSKQIEYSANLASASQALHLPLNDVRGAVEQLASNSFAMMTDSVDGTVKAMGAFIPALQATGLSGAQAIKVFGDIAGAMGNLDDATEAYVSSQTGGSGGLRGVFEFEEKMAKNPLNAAQDLMKSLKSSMGGEIVNREQASMSDEAAGQYEKQREMLQKLTGQKFGKGEQEHIFEAMQKGDFEAVAGKMIPTGDKAVANTAQQGAAIQEKMTTSVTEIRNAVNSIAAAQDIQLGISIMNKDKALAGGAVATHMKDAEVRAASIQKGSEISPDDIVSKTLSESANYAKTLVKNVSDSWTNVGAEKKEEPKPTTPPGFIGPPPPPTATTTSPAIGPPPPPVTTAATTPVIGAPLPTASLPTPSVPASLSHEEQGKVIQAAIQTHTAATNPVGPTAGTVRASAEAQQSPQTQAAPQTQAISVTGEIKGICIKCQQEELVDNVVAKAVKAVENREIQRQTGPMRSA